MQILPNITSSILLNIPKPQKHGFSVQYVSIFINITRLNQYSSIFTNITRATCRCNPGPARRPGGGPRPRGYSLSLPVTVTRSSTWFSQPECSTRLRLPAGCPGPAVTVSRARAGAQSSRNSILPTARHFSCCCFFTFHSEPGTE